MDNYIGQRIRAIRRSKKITQKEIAKKLGLSRDVICRMEKGRNMPSLKTIYRILDVIGADLIIEEDEI